MKEVYYSEKKTFLLTNAEFHKAKIVWNRGENFFCSRLDALLTRNYKWVDTPEEDKGYEVFVYPSQNVKLGRIWKKNDVYYRTVLMGETPIKLPLKFENEECQKELVNILIPQEEYYNQQKLLK